MDVTAKGALKDFTNVEGVYVHEFNTNTVYVGQAKNLAERPKTSLKELLDITKKGTAAKANASYTGKTQFIPLNGSGYTSLNELEGAVLKSYGGTIGQGGETYNIRRVPGQ